ncbi:MAG: MNIO family bufferin maturase [Thermodesulfobacteriota bacterium]
MIKFNKSRRLNLKSGIGLRDPHLQQIIDEKPNIGWFEIITDNLINADKKTLGMLEKIRSDYPFSLHSVGTSIGSVDELNFDYLEKLKELADRLEPFSISEHLCWSGAHGVHLHDLFPLPMTEETVLHVAGRVEQIQEYFGHGILIENVSAYTDFEESEMSEPQFITQIAKKSGSGILLDINNIFINSKNLGLDAKNYIDEVPKSLIGEMHLAGGEQREGYMLDSHSCRVWDEVWDLYDYALENYGQIPTLIEWDNEIPELSILIDEAENADRRINSKCVI